MLVLERKLDESVIIGSDIEVKVLGITRTRVKLGFAAPNTLIVRKELLERDRKQD